MSIQSFHLSVVCKTLRFRSTAPRTKLGEHLVVKEIRLSWRKRLIYYFFKLSQAYLVIFIYISGWSQRLLKNKLNLNRLWTKIVT